jgi:hypothetical protein
MKLELPNKVLECVSSKELMSGKFKFIGVKFSDEASKINLIVIDTAEQEIVGTYKTKMRTMEHMDMLLKRMVEDRQNRTYLPFGIYCTAWVSRTGQLKVPAKITKQKETIH